MEISQLVQDRVGVRKFSRKPVDEQDLKAILRAARLAPTPANTQPHHILVLTSRESMRKLGKCTRFPIEAPVVLALCSKVATVHPGAPERSGTVDTALVGAHIAQAVHRRKLRSTWVGHFDPEAFCTAFNLPLNLRPVALFPIGHPIREERRSALDAVDPFHLGMVFK